MSNIKNNKKLIGLVVSPLHDSNNVGINYRYVDYLSKFGDVLFLYSNMETVIDVDLLVLPGGADVDPARYGQRPHLRTQRPNIYLEHFDKHMLPQYIEAGIPIFGICRGMQSLSVHFGASLIQHLNLKSNLSTEREKLLETMIVPDNKLNSSIFEGTKFENIYNVVPKGQKIRSNSELEAPVTARFKGINSIHHQALDPNKLGPNIQVLGYSRNRFNNIEAIKIANHNIYGVQYHPECMERPHFADSLINKLLNT